MIVMRWFLILLDWLMLPFWPFAYLLARLEAKPCSKCGEKWYTELTGEWDGEDWHCRTCGHHWTISNSK